MGQRTRFLSATRSSTKARWSMHERAERWLAFARAGLLRMAELAMAEAL